MVHKGFIIPKIDDIPLSMVSHWNEELFIQYVNYHFTVPCQGDSWVHQLTLTGNQIIVTGLCFSCQH